MTLDTNVEARVQSFFLNVRICSLFFVPREQNFLAELERLTPALPMSSAAFATFSTQEGICR